MSVTMESAKRLNAMKQSIEVKTGETYINLTEAVQALLNGCGNSGGTTAILGVAKLGNMKLG